MNFPFAKAGAGMASLLVAVGMTGFAVAAQNPNAQAPNQTPAQQDQMNNENNGYSKAMVRQAQEQLKKDGDYTGNIDGIYGPETRAAVQKYQQSKNLKVNGKLDHQTCSKLGISNNK